MIMFLALGTLLALARALGEFCRRLSQPPLVGEIIAGMLLGPTVLGTLAPQLNGMLFPRTGDSALVMDGLTTLSIVLYLMVAGIEVNLSTIWKQGRSAFTVSIAGIVFPFLLGFSTAWFTPGLLGRQPTDTSLIFALFFATALSISALPVIVKTLRDLALYRTDMGMIVVASAVFDDLIGWILFAAILSTMDASGTHGRSIIETIGLTLAFAAGMLTVGRWLIHRILPWLQAHTSGPGGVLGFALCLALFGAATTEWIGIHAVFGSFFVGVAIGDSSHFREDTRTTIDQFVSYIFAPLFFASIGLRLNFATHFDWSLALVVIVIACAGKVLGCGLAALWSGMEQREAWATAFGLNARGAMEIILGVLALEHGLIQEQMFVALVALAVTTSLMSGPAMWHLLRLTVPRRFIDHLSPSVFLNRLRAGNYTEAIEELSQAVSSAVGLSAETITTAVLEREHTMPTGIGNGVAVPHARLEGLPAPVVGVGLTDTGIDFNAPDGQLAHVVFVILTPTHDHGAQIDILADIARTFDDAAMHEAALQVRSYTELLALLRAGGAPHAPRRPWPRPYRRAVR